jgi:hypothetical protein
VLLLDDSGVGTRNTLAIQTMADVRCAHGRPRRISVVRLNNRRDEPSAIAEAL